MAQVTLKFYVLFHNLKSPLVRDSLVLSIRHRMLREGSFTLSSWKLTSFPFLEVEEIIEQEVEAVLESTPSGPHNRIIVVGKLIDALESDAAWVELYGITGELIVPDIHNEGGEIGELLKKAKKVRHDCPLSPSMCLTRS